MKNVLIIEDDTVLLGMYRDKFKLNDFAVTTAIDGKEGLDLALRDHPDIILLDIILPRMNGAAVMKELRKDEWGRGVPVILLTNLNVDGKLIEDILETKPAYCLLKANTVPSDVLAKAEEVLAEKEAQA